WSQFNFGVQTMWKIDLLKSGGLLMCLAVASPSFAATFQITLFEESIGTGGGASNFEWTVNNKGTAARQGFFRDPPGGSASDNFYSIQTFPTQGAPKHNFSKASPVGPPQFVAPVINDAGDFLATTRTGRPGTKSEYVELSIIRADGTKVILAENPIRDSPSRPGIPDFSALDAGAASINASGVVAAAVRLEDGTTQIVKFNPSTGTKEVVATETPDFVIDFRQPDINDHGKVAFAAIVPGVGQSIYVGDETGFDVVIEGNQNTFQPGSSFSLNNDGDVIAGIVTRLSDVGYIIQNANEPTASPIILGKSRDVGFVQTVALNNFDQFAYTIGGPVGGDLYIDGELVLARGDTFEGLSGDVSQLGVGLRTSHGFNDLGQVVATIAVENQPHPAGLPFTVTGNADFRVDPEGATPDNPLVPFASTSDGQNDVALNINNGLGLTAPIFVDPIVATGFTYTQGAGGANFASLLIPDALPLGDDDFLLEFMYGAGSMFSDTILAGEIFDFTALTTDGVSSFTISDIDFAEMIDPTDPFVVGLTFVAGGFSSTLSIDAITEGTDTNVIPLPASLPLLLVSLGGLAFLQRKRRLMKKEQLRRPQIMRWL
ncbi:MAG: VPLPA-CTERM sorting domain-containing protein, partial [Pseudomonadota bacterium]